MSVYFIQMGGPRGPVKIGSADNVEKRRKTLQTANPYTLLTRRVIEGGGTRLEHKCHKYFDARRCRGEWFYPCDEMWSLSSADIDARIPDAAISNTEGRTKDILEGTVRYIIHQAGGARVVAEACGVHPAKPAGWYKSGVPLPHWRTLMRLSGADETEMFSAWEAARNGERPGQPLDVP